ncbi:MAG: DeoR/GlpR transcriptional regulator [Ruminococcaceae bacterium]|nr:DeoR/GlpR transcriptional regulator [Oscillospiraceae bacterium]
MSQKLRHEQILHILETRGFVTVRYLTEKLQYSTATVNRDLNTLQNAGLVKRSYGGVEAAKRSHLPAFLQRQFYMKKEKRCIAEAAAALVKEGETVFLSSGTTVQHMAPFLLQKKPSRIITNNMHLAIDLADAAFEVICLGGRITEKPYVLGGDITIEQALHYQPDKMFFSTAAVTNDGLVGGQNVLLRIMMKVSAEVWLLTDRTKRCDRTENVLFDFSSLTGVISDYPFSDELKARYESVRFLELDPTTQASPKKQ